MPRGKYLTCPGTNEALLEVFDALASQAAKLAPLASSQVDESFNNAVCSKAPKARHYGGSESNDLRVAAAVLKKNEGKLYVPAVLAEAGLPAHMIRQVYV